jgi:hypothetical protein
MSFIENIDFNNDDKIKNENPLSKVVNSFKKIISSTYNNKRDKKNTDIEEKTQSNSYQNPWNKNILYDKDLISEGVSLSEVIQRYKTFPKFGNVFYSKQIFFTSNEQEFKCLRALRKNRKVFPNMSFIERNDEIMVVKMDVLIPIYC